MKRAGGLLAAACLGVIAAWAGHRAHQAALHADFPPDARAVVLPADEPLEPGIVASHSIPDQLPPFTLPDLLGHATPVSNWQGKALIINFWATWCAPCRREMPLLQALDRTWSDRNFRVIGIAVDRRDAVEAYSRSLQIGYPLLIGEEDALQVASRLGVTTPAFPFTVFTDRRGRIIALYIGELHKPETDLILSTVLEVNLDRLPVEAARERIAAGLAKLHGASAA